MPTKKTTTKPTRAPQKRDVVIERVLNAPRERVWKAWTDPTEMRRWWGPQGFTTPTCKVDLRVGGAYIYCMRSPEGKDYWATGTYREIVPQRKLVMTDSFADEKGNVVPATYYGMSAETPLEMLVTATFEDAKGKTKLTLRHAGFPVGLDSEGAQQGWSESFDKLAEVLGKPTMFGTLSDREIRMERVFDAPRERVFQAYTDPKLIPLWWGPRRYATIVDKMDVRPGGAWRYINRAADGTEFAFRGVYREVVRPRRLVSTFEFEGVPGHIVVDTATFEDLGGKTKVTVTSRFETAEDLAQMLQSGMEEGATESWDRLEELVTKT